MAENTTKDTILSASIHLFADNGYDAVSMKDIAKKVGIKPSSIYNHFDGKESILEAIYTYYRDHCLLPQLREKEYLPILQTGTITDILNIFNYPHHDVDEETPLMFSITRILFSRLHIDGTAREIYREYIMDDGIRYIHTVLGKCISIGRLSLSTEEVDRIASLILSSRVFVANSVVAEPNPEKWRKQETDMIQILAQLLPLGPPQNPD